MTNQTPIMAGRYVLTAGLGQGGMGAVYKATDRLTGKSVALKQVHVPVQHLFFQSKANTDDYRLALAQEFRVLSTLRHPHIISVYDFGFTNEQLPYYTMELLDQPIPITKANIDEPEKINLIIQLLQALDYLHRRGIIHQDLKPSNVMISNGHLKVLDFGLARERTEATVDKAGEKTAGTTAYMAPELFENMLATKESDFWAVGLMMYEIFAGKHPFYSSNMAFLLNNILNNEPDLDSLPVNDGFKAVIGRLLAKKRHLRYHTAYDIIEAICEAAKIPLPAESSAIRESYLQAARFVGREAELEQLTATLPENAQMPSTIWLLGGESGVGKSRLAEELRTRALVDGVFVLRGHAVEGGGLPFQLWRDLVRRMLLIKDVDDLQAGILKEIVPDIEAPVGREVADVPAIDGTAQKERLIFAIVDLFRELTQPTLLLLEDLQWTGESLDVLKQMLRVIEQLPGLMILGTYRHDERPQLATELKGAQAVILDRLNEKEVAQLSEAMLGERANQPHIVSLLNRETEGNTFFIVEVMRALAEEAGQLDHIGEMELPEGVITGGMQRILQRRIQRVPEGDQPLLQLAAIAGRQLDLQVLKVLAGDTVLDGWLQRASDAAVLTVNENQWLFAHDKLRAAIVNDINVDQKPALHRRVAQVIEQVYPDDENYYEVLLDHWHRAGDLDREIHYLNPVAERLIMISADYIHAEKLLERGLNMLANDDVRRGSLLSWQAQSYQSRGDYLRSKAAAQQALQLAERFDMKHDIARSLRTLGMLAYHEAEYGLATDYFQRSLQIYRVINDQVGIGRGLGSLGNLAYLQRDYTHARDYVQQSLDISRTVNDQHSIAFNLITLGRVAVDEGEHELATQYFQQSLDISKATRDLVNIALNLDSLGTSAHYRGEYALAQEHYKQSLALFREIGNKEGEASSLGNLGGAAYAQGNYVLAQEYFQQSLDLSQAIGEEVATMITQGNLGFVFLRLGDRRANSLFCKALAAATSISFDPLVLDILIGLSWLFLEDGKPSRSGELVGLIQSHPAFIIDVQHRLNEFMPSLENALEPDDLHAAMERGKLMDLNKVVERLLKDCQAEQ
ncbi:MAG: tetratricopeptide repeat protein [Chloroflexi bacterium]|nr:tetratricopeptide repeat protein [Chloroflexota bacterium]